VGNVSRVPKVILDPYKLREVLTGYYIFLPIFIYTGPLPFRPVQDNI
jgi:hypothetical protein